MSSPRVVASPLSQSFVNSPWTLYLANSSNMQIIGPLVDAKNFSLEATLNRPGRANFVYPSASPLAVSIIPVFTCVILMYKDQILWSGPVWSSNETEPDGRKSVIAVGWSELLYHRVLRVKTTYTEKTRGSIILALLGIANAQKDTWISAGNDADSAPVLTKTFEAFENIGQAIELMTTIEAGPDYYIDPATRKLHIKTWDSYADHPEILWAYGWGPHNVESFSRQTDVDSMVNRLNVAGKNSDTIRYVAQDLTSQADFQLFESQTTLSSISDQNVLAAYGEAEVVYRGTPRVTYTFQPHGGANQPLIFRDFALGDKCRLRAVAEPNIEVEQDIRVFSAQLSIDENGNHKLNNVVTVAS